jgi:hypothetical protein
MRALLLLAKRKNIYEADLEEAAEQLNDEDENISEVPN